MSEPARRGESPILSVIIPTRERSAYLNHCVRSALAVPSEDIEVIVSDNASNDDTRAVVDGFDDKRLVYANPGVRIPMYDNFEFALGKSRGRYLTFIGDDDAVLPAGILRLIDLLCRESPEVVNWPLPGYVWPGAANGVEGLLTLKPTHIQGGKSIIDSRHLLDTLAQGSNASYRFGGARIYHGCVARHIVADVIARTGSYFFVPWPDVGASIANLFVTRHIMMLGEPCTIAGESPASSGRSLRFQEKQRAEQTNPFARFIHENQERSHAVSVDARIRPISALTFLTLLETIRRMGAEQNVCVNVQAWLAMMESELAAMPEPARTEQADIVDSGLQVFRLPGVDRAWSRKRKSKRARVHSPVRSHRLLPNRICIVSRPGLCGNVFQAAQLVDRILSTKTVEKPKGRIALAAAWVGALVRARQLLSRRSLRESPSSRFLRETAGLE